MAALAGGEWSRSKWTEAAQVVAEVGGEAEPAEEHEAPHAYCARLVAAGRLAEAVTFLAHALPRYECVVWAARALIDEGAAQRGEPLITAVLRWIDSPDDAQRLAALEAAEAAGDDLPARLLALAVYLSGGSLSQPELPPVLPPGDVCAKLAAGALVKAAYLGEQPDAALRRMVTSGTSLAAAGQIG